MGRGEVEFCSTLAQRYSPLKSCLFFFCTNKVSVQVFRHLVTMSKSNQCRRTTTASSKSSSELDRKISSEMVKEAAVATVTDSSAGRARTKPFNLSGSAKTRQNDSVSNRDLGHNIGTPPPEAAATRDKTFASAGNSSAKIGGRISSAVNPAPATRQVEICLCCVKGAFQIKEMFGMHRQPTCPNLNTIKEFISVHGPEEADREFGLSHEFLDIKIVGHQQFSRCICAKNSVLPDVLLDQTLGPDDFVLLKVVEGRDAGYALNSKGVEISKMIVDKLFTFINADRSRVHPDCSILRTEEQVKNAGLSMNDIHRCTNGGCIFNFSAEAFVRFCRMHSIPISSDSVGEAFMLQVELEKRRLMNEAVFKEGSNAFIDILEADYQAIDIIGYFLAKYESLFSTACTARILRQAFAREELNPIDSIMSTVNRWLVDNGQEPRPDVRECIDALLSDINLAISFEAYVKKIYHKISLRAHPDKTILISNRAERTLLESIFKDTVSICLELRKFLFTGGDNEPTISLNDLFKYRRLVAKSASCLEHVNKAREANVLRIANSAWAGLFIDSDSTNSAASSTNSTCLDLTTWEEKSQALMEFVDTGLFNGIQAAREIAPEVVETLVVAIIDAKKSGESSGVVQTALVELAYASGVVATEDLVEMQGCYGALIRTSFPEVHDQLWPTIGASSDSIVVSEETERITILARKVEDGLKAKADLEEMESKKKECEEEIVVDSRVVAQSNADKMAALSFTHKKMSDTITQYKNKIFKLLNGLDADDEAFIACIELFLPLAPDAIREIIDLWTNRSETSSDEKSEFIKRIGFMFTNALSKYDYNAQTLYQMTDKIKAKINEFVARRQANAPGTGRRANSKFVVACEKFPMPSACEISKKIIDNIKGKIATDDEHKGKGVAVFQIRASIFDRMKKEDRESEEIHGYKYKIHSTKLEGQVDVHTVLFFNKREEKEEEEEGDKSVVSFDPFTGYAPSDSIIDKNNYVLLNHRTISPDGIFCKTFDGEVMTLMEYEVPIAKTRGTKINGRVEFDDGVTKVGNRNKRSGSKVGTRAKYGSTMLETCKIPGFVKERYGDFPIIPLVGVVENGIVVDIWTGNESNYHKVVNNLLRNTNCMVFGTIGDMKTLYDVSLIRKDDKPDKISRYVERACDDGAQSQSELFFSVAKSNQVSDFERELNILKECCTETVSKEDIGINWLTGNQIDNKEHDEKRMQWLTDRIANPISETDAEMHSQIFSAIGSKIVFENNETRDEIIQILRDGFGEWTPLEDRTSINMSLTDAKAALNSVKSALNIAFNGSPLLFQKLDCAVNKCFERAVAPKTKNNNFTPNTTKTHFYESLNSNRGTRSKGRVAFGGR